MDLMGLDVVHAGKACESLGAENKGWLIHEYCLQWIIQSTIFMTACDENVLLTPISIKLPCLPIHTDGQRILMKTSTAAFNVYLINKYSTC